MDTFSASDVFGVAISTQKTEVMFQPHTNHSDPTITVKSQKLPTVDKFTYLGNALSRNVIIDDDAEARIVWERQGLNLQTKLNVYKAVVMTSYVLCACEIWTVYCRHARKLNRFHINCLRRLLCITWQDMIPDTEVLESAGLQSIHTILTKAQLRWAGHVFTMSNERLPKHLPEGKRSTGGQRKRYKDSLKSPLNAFEINNGSWESLAPGTAISGRQLGHTNKPGYARRKKGDYSTTPVLRKEALRLTLIFNARTATKRFVPESALSATSGHIAYLRQTS